MKTLLYKIIFYASMTISVFLTFSACAASNKNQAPVEGATPNPPAPTTGPVIGKPKFTYSTIKSIESFSQRRLADRDLNSVKKVIETLVLLDDQDPSRTAVMMLSESYGRHKRIYDRAFKSLETPQNKSQLQEIRELMIHFSEDGNG